MSPTVVSHFPHFLVRGGKQNTPVVAGRIQLFLDKWKELTHDPGILNAVKGYKIELFVPPVQFTTPRPIKFSSQETANVNAQIS